MKNILEYLEAAALKYAERTAFADEQSSLSFGTLLQHARIGGSRLLERGCMHEPVAVFLTKSPETVAAFFAVIYAGCCYVPLEKGMPQYRIRMILQKLQPRIIICGSEEAETAGTLGWNDRILRTEELFSGEENTAALAAVRANSIDTDPIYIVFTSGSTGIPKGVTACHRSVIDYAGSLLPVLGADENSIFAMQVPLYVDACLKELLAAVCCGSEVWLMPQALFVQPVAAVEYLNRHRVNTLCWVASALSLISGLGAFDEIRPQYLRTVCFGSEVFPVRQLHIWQEAAPGARFLNLYGPTECTGMSFWYEVSREFTDAEAIPIGRPFDNTGFLLLKEDNTEALPGETGEICIRGTPVTLGYYDDPERTEAAFVQNPLNSHWPERIYRTGDLARSNERGELVFVSRKDNQIKNMGHRIELGEIELCACGCEDVGSAACLWDAEKKKLILYYMGKAENRRLQVWLRGELPRHMLPSKIYRLETLPMLPNGKLDRNALREIYNETKERK